MLAVEASGVDSWSTCMMVPHAPTVHGNAANATANRRRRGIPLLTHEPYRVLAKGFLWAASTMATPGRLADGSADGRNPYDRFLR
jgi:hypothetical protein